MIAPNTGGWYCRQCKAIYGIVLRASRPGAWCAGSRWSGGRRHEARIC